MPVMWGTTDAKAEAYARAVVIGAIVAVETARPVIAAGEVGAAHPAVGAGSGHFAPAAGAIGHGDMLARIELVEDAITCPRAGPDVDR
jgi:hypothetical protein